MSDHSIEYCKTWGHKKPCYSVGAFENWGESPCKNPSCHPSTRDISFGGRRGTIMQFDQCSSIYNCRELAAQNPCRTVGASQSEKCRRRRRRGTQRADVRVHISLLQHKSSQRLIAGAFVRQNKRNIIVSVASLSSLWETVLFGFCSPAEIKHTTQHKRTGMFLFGRVRRIG